MSFHHALSSILQRHTLAAFIVSSGAALLTGCGGSSSSTVGGAETVSINIPFTAVAGNTEITCQEDIPSLGSTGTAVRFTDFRFYVHDIKLITDEGQEIAVVMDASEPGQNAQVALLDFRDTLGCSEGTAANPNYKNSVSATVSLSPELVIAKVRFTLGVPATLNHAPPSSAEEPLRDPGLASGMSWGWQNGYKFTGLDVEPVAGVSRPGNPSWSSLKWSAHLGNTGCTYDRQALEQGADQECPSNNRPTITLSLGGRQLGKDAAIKIDYAQLVSDSDLSTDEAYASGCMSKADDPECESIFIKFGLPWGSVEAAEQAVFSIIEQQL